MLLSGQTMYSKHCLDWIWTFLVIQQPYTYTVAATNYCFLIIAESAPNFLNFSIVGMSESKEFLMITISFVLSDNDMLISDDENQLLRTKF